MTQPAPTPTPTPTPGDPAPAPAPTPPAPTPAPAPAPTPTPGEPAKADEPLGPAGLKALREERAAREALEKRVAALAPLERIASALVGQADPASGKSEVDLLQERFAQHEQDLAAERSARWRAEVAAEKGLTAAQAARLVGGTREELLADADALVALFPGQSAAGRTPAPDPSQGSRGTDPAADLDAQIAEAQKAGKVREVIRLNGLKATALAAKNTR